MIDESREGEEADLSGIVILSNQSPFEGLGGANNIQTSRITDAHKVIVSEIVIVLIHLD